MADAPRPPSTNPSFSSSSSASTSPFSTHEPHHHPPPAVPAHPHQHTPLFAYGLAHHAPPSDIDDTGIAHPAAPTPSIQPTPPAAAPATHYHHHHHQPQALIAGYRSSSMKLKRSDRVRAMMGAVPSDMPRLFPHALSPEVHSRSYHLTIVEQPLQCRACGFSTSDRRPMDPVPVVHLQVHDAQGQPVDPEAPENLFFILHARLWSVDLAQAFENVLHPQLADSLHNSNDAAPSFFATHHLARGAAASSSPSSAAAAAAATAAATPTPSVAVLVGSLVSSASIYTDLYDRRAIYFAFPDLSVRLTGQFRLRFTLFCLGRSDTILAEAYSDPFTVYPAKLFPGMRESSALALHLSRQGLRIPVRSKERPKRKLATSNKTDQ